MAKIKSNFLTMFGVLTIVTIVSSALLAETNALTKDAIAVAEKEKQVSAIREVVPDFDNQPLTEVSKVEEDGDYVLLFPAKKNGELVGMAVESFTDRGFNGKIRVMVGFDLEGSIRNYRVLQHGETPGLGSKMEAWFRTNKAKQSIIGLNLAQKRLVVSKDGGDVDAITAATISSRAFLDAVNRAYKHYKIYVENNTK